MELHLATPIAIDRRSSVSSAVWSAEEDSEAAALPPVSDSAASQPVPTKRAAASTPTYSQPLPKKWRQAQPAAAAAVEGEGEGEDQEAVEQSSVTVSESDHVVRGVLARQFLAASQQLQLPAAAVLRVGGDADIQQLEQYDQREMAKGLLKLWELGYNKVSTSACAAPAAAVVRQVLDWLVLA